MIILQKQKKQDIRSFYHIIYIMFFFGIRMSIMLQWDPLRTLSTKYKKNLKLKLVHFCRNHRGTYPKRIMVQKSFKLPTGKRIALFRNQPVNILLLWFIMGLFTLYYLY